MASLNSLLLIHREQRCVVGSCIEESAVFGEELRANLLQVVTAAAERHDDCKEIAVQVLADRGAHRDRLQAERVAAEIDRRAPVRGRGAREVHLAPEIFERVAAVERSREGR